MSDLYLDKLPEFDRSMRKHAAFVARMSERPDSWPQEVVNEMHKQLPYLSDYDLDVKLDRIDQQRGYAFGYGEVRGKSTRPPQEQVDAEMPAVKIPVIIVDRSLKPFKVFLDGERTLPLNEERLREALFNPATFDLSDAQQKDPWMLDSLYPPTRGSSFSGEIKSASVSKTAFQHISEQQWQALYQNEKVQKLFEKFQDYKHPEIENEVYKLAANIYGYHPKTASVAGKQKVSRELTAKSRNSLPDGAFVFPRERRFPIHDRPHAANALARASGTSDEGAVEAAVRSKYPDMGKGKTSSLLRRIAHTIPHADADRFVEKVASSPTLRASFRRSGVADTLVDVFDNTPRPATGEEALLKLSESVLPTTVTFLKLPGGNFLVKSANVDALVQGPQMDGQQVPQDYAADAMGEDQAAAMQPGDTLTATQEPVPEEPGPDQQEMAAAQRAKPAEEFGEYKVQDSQGNQLLGWVFPHSMAWDGSFSPNGPAVFTNGSAWALQDQIVGELVGKGTNLPKDEPRGDGTFYSVVDGEASCTVPVTVGSSAAGPDGMPKFQATDPTGAPLVVSLQPGLAAPVQLGDNEYALPDSWRFMRLNNQTQLAGDQGQLAKSAALRDALHSVEVLHSNGSFSIRGKCGLEKVSSRFTTFVDHAGAEFMLGLLGVGGARAQALVKEARRRGHVKVSGLKTIRTLGERYAGAEKRAQARLESLPALRLDLLKEATALEDESTVDHVLALNFVNPDNLASFVEAIPELDETSMKLATMLLMSYVGSRDLPEEPIERAMTGMEEVLRNLKAMAHAGSP